MELIFSEYFTELIAVISITMLTIITPGPDFIIVARNSLAYSRRSGVMTAAGVATAVWIHVAYTLAGIGLILSQSIFLYSLIKYLGAAYLVYLGVSCVKGAGNSVSVEAQKSSQSITSFRSYQMGFLNNALNPKATVFFVSLFTQLVSTTTPLSVQIIYGAIVSISCFVWFSCVAMFLNTQEIRHFFLKIQKHIERVMGGVLIAVGLKVASSS